MTPAGQILGSGFDLDSLDTVAETVLFKVAVMSDIDGNDICGFMIDSKNCNEYQTAQQKVRIEGLKRSAKRKSQLDTSTDDGAGVVARMIESNEMALSLSVVKGWFGFKQGGVEVPFNKDTVSKMFAKYPTWKDKVNAALENEANFIKG